MNSPSRHASSIATTLLIIGLAFFPLNPLFAQSDPIECDELNVCSGEWLPGNDIFEQATVELDGYPGCSVLVFYQYRICVLPGDVIQTREYRIDKILFGPFDDGDPEDPCADLFRDFELHRFPALSRQGFEREIYQKATRALALSEFEKLFAFDEALKDTDAEAMAKYQAKLCGNGSQNFRVHQGSCIDVWTKYIDCPTPPSSGIGHVDGDQVDSVEKGVLVSAPANDPPTLPTCRDTRYQLCSPDGPCCVEVFEICRYIPPVAGQEAATHVNRRLETTGSGGVDCSTLPSTPIPGQGYESTGCMPMCEDNHPPPSVVAPDSDSNPDLTERE